MALSISLVTIPCFLSSTAVRGSRDYQEDGVVLQRLKVLLIIDLGFILKQHKGDVLAGIGKLLLGLVNQLLEGGSNHPLPVLDLPVAPAAAHLVRPGPPGEAGTVGLRLTKYFSGFGLSQAWLYLPGGLQVGEGDSFQFVFSHSAAILSSPLLSCRAAVAPASSPPASTLSILPLQPTKQTGEISNFQKLQMYFLEQVKHSLLF